LTCSCSVFPETSVDNRIEYFATSTVDQDDSHVNTTCHASKLAHSTSQQGSGWDVGLPTFDLEMRTTHKNWDGWQP